MAFWDIIAVDIFLSEHHTYVYLSNTNTPILLQLEDSLFFFFGYLHEVVRYSTTQRSRAFLLRVLSVTERFLLYASL